ncbi:MAG: aldo/keto reductase [Anaerolineales bacterium]|nr:aldo/keto reductase [Anaerolineales bacterium]
MQYGSIAGLAQPVSRLVQGGAMFGDTFDAAAGADLFDAVLALGCTMIDTAHIYGGGASERAIGSWLARGPRERVLILSKGAHPDAKGPRVTPAAIARDLRESLDRLQTDYIDLYLLHRDDPRRPVGPLVEALNEHLAAGRVRAIGVSNWSSARITAANTYAALHGLTPLVASSPHFGLAEQRAAPWPDAYTLTGAGQAAERDWYVRTQTPVLSWSSLASGFFSGRYSPDRLDELNSPTDQMIKRVYCTPANFNRLARANALAAERGVSVAQVALAYSLSQPLNLFALVGAVSGAEYADCAAALDLNLTPADLDWLDLRRPARP